MLETDDPYCSILIHPAVAELVFATAFLYGMVPKESLRFAFCREQFIYPGH